MADMQSNQSTSSCCGLYLPTNLQTIAYLRCLYLAVLLPEPRNWHPAVNLQIYSREKSKARRTETDSMRFRTKVYSQLFVIARLTTM